MARSEFGPPPGLSGEYALMATMRDEAPRLLEWVAHHRAAGFGTILIASNHCTDGTDAMLDRLAALGILLHMPNQLSFHPYDIRMSAYARGRAWPEIATAKWLLTLDADEFFVSHVANGTVTAWIKSLPRNVQAVQIACRLFGSDTEDSEKDKPLVTETFLRAAEDAQAAKIMTRLHTRFPEIGPLGPTLPSHTPPERRFDANTCTASGQKMGKKRLNRSARPLFNPPDAPDCWAGAQINHYSAMTPALFIQRRQSGHADTAKPKSRRPISLDAFQERDRNECEDKSALRLAEARSDWLDRLLTDPILSGLHDTAVREQERKLKKIKNTREYRMLCPNDYEAQGVRGQVSRILKRTIKR